MCLGYIKPIEHQSKAVEAFPLTGALVTSEVVDFSAHVFVKQRFENRFDQPLEAVYEFFVTKNSSICGFFAELDGKVIRGELLEKEEAKDVYDDAISSGSGAYLLEENENAERFSISLGNVLPKTEVLIVLEYVTELSFEDEELIFSLPGVAGNDKKFLATPLPSSKLWPEIPYGFQINVNFRMSSNVKSIRSVSHPISFEFGGTPQEANVSLSELLSTPLSKDFICAVKLFSPNEPSVICQENEDGKKVCMLCFYPNFDVSVMKNEIIFLVDRSGSMSGSKMRQTISALQTFLRSLDEGVLFNIISFGNRFTSLFEDGSRPYDEDSLAIASLHVDEFRANYGGTNILTPLTSILAKEAIPGVPRQVFVLTDGQVNNRDRCAGEVKKHALTTRVFTFGIGRDADAKLVKSMASAGNGRAEMILNNQEIDRKVMLQLKFALKPALMDLTVEWSSSLPGVQSPYRLPPLFSGDRLIVYRFLEKAVSDGEVTIRALIGEAQVEKIIAVNPFAPCSSLSPSHLFALAGRSSIRDLMDGCSPFHCSDGSLVTNITKDTLKKEMISLSLENGILCPHTAFVAVDERLGQVTNGAMKLMKSNSVGDEPKERHRFVKKSCGRRPMQIPDNDVPRPLSVDFDFLAASAPAPAASSSSPPAPPSSSGFLSNARNLLGFGGGGGKHSGRKGGMGGMSDMSGMCREKKISVKNKKKETESVSKCDMSDDDEEGECFLDFSTSSPPPPAPASMAKPILETAILSDAELKKLKDIIRLQKASGRWDPDVLPLLSLEKSSLKVSFSGTKLPENHFVLWVTAVVVAFIVYQFPSEEVLFDMVISKAKRYLHKEISATNVGDSSIILDLARDFVQQDS